MRIGPALLVVVMLQSLTAVAVQAQANADEVAASPRIQRYALLIGVNEYAPPLGGLAYCHQDMTDLQAHLVAAGFSEENIVFMNEGAEQPRHRPTRSNIEGELRLRLALANPDDIVLVAFSGHGVHIDGKSYLCPSDTKLDAVSSMVAIDDVYALLEACPASQKLLIVDACRNEPIVRGFRSGKLAEDLSMQMQSPPRGLIVLSSCEAGQFSIEDAQLKHGVFMHYIMQGLTGKADTDVAVSGNNNGRISLDELYFYAHERTKRHVAGTHGIVQRPVLRGEITGRFDLALVPDAERLKVLEERPVVPDVAVVKPTEAKPVDVTPMPEPTTSEPTQVATIRSIDHPLLLQADRYLRQADHVNAIAAYSAIIDDSGLAVEVRREARKNRGVAFLARGDKNDINNALIDQHAAGLPGIYITVRAATAELKVVNDVVGKVQQNQSLLVTKSEGDWLWVDAVDGSDKLQGYIVATAVMKQPEPPAPAPVAAARPQTNYPQGYNNNGNYNNGNNGRYSSSNNSNNRSNSGDNKPKSIWATPEWESFREIREGRAAGRLK